MRHRRTPARGSAPRTPAASHPEPCRLAPPVPSRGPRAWRRNGKSTTLSSKISERSPWKRGAGGWAYPPSSGRVSTQTSRPSPATASPSAVLPAAETAAALIGDSQDPYESRSLSEWRGECAAERRQSVSQLLPHTDTHCSKY